jgi:ABC-type nitrate/sulfonate/bicarbonate transport system substrate-binding protein
MRRALPLLALSALLLAACGGSGGSSTATHAAPRTPRDATLVLDFTPNAVHTGVYAALAHGYDRAAGVRLHVQVPGSSTDSAKLLLANRVQLAIMDIHDLALARAQGRPLVGVMALVQRPLAAVLAQPDVRTPRALEGKRVGVTGVPSDDAVLSSIVAGAGGDPHQVKRVTIGFDAVPALLGGKVAGATAFWNDEGIALRAKRPATHVFRVDDYGAPAYPELVLVTTRAQLTDDRSLVADAVHALQRGYADAIARPQAAAAALEHAVPGLDAAQVATQLHALLPIFARPDEHPGTLDGATLARWAIWEQKFGIVTREPDVTQLFDRTLAR